jgi:TolB-like protein/class 3 adenylate cyclase/Tfp pilus assembly protein PilF
MTERGVERRLAAVLAADVAGYSRLMGEDEEGTLARLKAYRRDILDPKICENRGRIVKTTGDGLLAEFASVIDALRCAVEIQRDVAQRNTQMPSGERIDFRLGLNVGDIIFDADDIFGDGVNVAARLEALAEPGGICVSARVQEDAHGKMDLLFEDMGEQKLKNIARTVRAYRVTLDGVRAIPRSIAAERDRPSIAILPFTNMSDDPDQQYFSDGITQDIITELSRFRSLLVIARNASFQYRGPSLDILLVGRELGVEYLVEGSVRRGGNRVRVTAQLIEAQTGNHLWADRFDRDLDDIFAVQDEVTRHIVTNIAPVLTADSLRMARRKPPEDMRAYDCLLRAHVLVGVARNTAELREGRALCDLAIRIDPTFARAHSCRSLSFTTGIMTIEADDTDEWRRQALISAETAVALDPADAANHMAMAWACFLMVNRDRSLSHCAKAVALNPNDTDVLVDAAFIYGCYGNNDQALRHLRAARERNPAQMSVYSWAGGCMFYMIGQYREAVAAFEAYGEPNESIHLWRAASLVKLGRIDEAQANLRGALTLKPKLTTALAKDIFRYLPECDDFVEALRHSGLPD